VTKKSSIQNTSKKPYNNVVKLCAAGSGKTYGICQDSLSLVTSSVQRKRILMITFTNNGVATINKYIAIQNQGLPSNKVVVCTWFQFLLTEFIRPYQSFILGINEVKSFDFENHYPKYKTVLISSISLRYN
jgi:DNA helicase-2/ATP-dependent DNA helicase PcrA